MSEIVEELFGSEERATVEESDIRRWIGMARAEGVLEGRKEMAREEAERLRAIEKRWDDPKHHHRDEDHVYGLCSWCMDDEAARLEYYAECGWWPDSPDPDAKGDE